MYLKTQPKRYKMQIIMMQSLRDARLVRIISTGRTVPNTDIKRLKKKIPNLNSIILSCLNKINNL